MARDIEILLEDDDLLVINKPAGVLSVPGRHGGRDVGARGAGTPDAKRRRFVSSIASTAIRAA